MNIQIFSRIYFGSDKQGFDLIFDSGSSWVWVENKLCGNCANPNKFDHKRSSSFTQLVPTISSLHYGKGTVYGYNTKDEICLNKDSELGHGCMSDYLFKSVVYQESLNGLGGSGIVGLSPSSQHDKAQLFVPSLYEQGAIKKNMFSMFIDNLDETNSKIQIGGYDLNKYASSDITWHKLVDNNYWEFNFSNVTIGDHQLTPSTDIMMADTGTSLNMVPDHDFFAIYDMFFKDKFDCHVLKNTLYSCKCT